MQVLVLAVQNAVDYEMLGVATSGATLFRSIGGSLGTAILGAIFTNRLTSELAGAAGRPAVGASRRRSTRRSSQRLPAADPRRPTSAPSPTRSDSSSSSPAAIMAVAFLLSWLLEERPLRKTVETAGVGEAFAVPRELDAMRELLRELSVLAGRDRSRRFLERAAGTARASTSRRWSAGCSTATGEGATSTRLAGRDAPASTRPRSRRLARRAARRASCSTARSSPTPGARRCERLLDGAHQELERLVDDWSPEERPELEPVLGRFSRELAGEPPR